MFVEFGSGRGQLTYWLAKACSRKRTDEEDGGVQGDEGPVLVPAHVLVDKASHRHKYDNKLKDGDHDSAANVHRIRCDIQDLVLAKVPAVRDGAGDDDDAGRSSQPTASSRRGPGVQAGCFINHHMYNILYNFNIYLLF